MSLFAELKRRSVFKFCITYPMAVCSAYTFIRVEIERSSLEISSDAERSAPGRLQLYLPLKFRLGVWLLWRQDRPFTPSSWVYSRSRPTAELAQ